MKKQEFLKAYHQMNRINARRMIFFFCIIISYLIARSPIWIFKSQFVNFMIPLDEGSKITVLALIFVGAPVLMAYLFTVLAMKKGYDLKLVAFWEKKRQQKIDALNTELVLIKEQQRDIIQLGKESYTISGLSPTNEPFVFDLCLNEQIEDEMTPIVRCNGNPIGYRKITPRNIELHLRKYITAEDETIKISIGNKKEVEFKNPYHLVLSGEAIRWQCEGHGYQRLILVPISYFPQFNPEVIYQFKFRIGKTLFGNFQGKFNESHKSIVVYLGKDVQKSDMRGDNKTAILSLPFGGENRIDLPKPTIVFKENERIL